MDLQYGQWTYTDISLIPFPLFLVPPTRNDLPFMMTLAKLRNFGVDHDGKKIIVTSPPFFNFF